MCVCTVSTPGQHRLAPRGPHLYMARPASTSIQSKAKSICRTKEDTRFTTECATLRTTAGCLRMMLWAPQSQPRPPAAHGQSRWLHLFAPGHSPPTSLSGDTHLAGGTDTTKGQDSTAPGQLSTASWPGSPAASGQRLWESLGAPPTTSCGAQTTHKAPSLAASQAPASTMCHEDQSGGRDGAGGLRRRVRPRGRRQGSGAWSLEKHGGEVQGGLGRNTRVPVC